MKIPTKDDHRKVDGGKHTRESSKRGGDDRPYLARLQLTCADERIGAMLLNKQEAYEASEGSQEEKRSRRIGPSMGTSTIHTDVHADQGRRASRCTGPVHPACR